MKRFVALLAAALLMTGCGGGASTSTPEPSESSSPVASAAGTEDVIVFAAASLNKAFPEIAPAKYSFDGSSGLVDQLQGGAPADVFASADKKNMDRAVSEGLIEGEPVLFATNYLGLVTPADNPGEITGFDSSLDGKKLVICAADVPCGAATLKVAEANGLTLNPVSEESKVTDVLGKVTAGEADAGLVYATDAASAGDKVKVFDIPGAEDDPNTYWIASVKGAPHAEGATEFITLVTEPDGAATLAKYGFGPATTE